MQNVPQSEPKTDATQGAREAALSTMAAWVAAIADNVRNPINGIAAALDILEGELLVQKPRDQSADPLVEDALRRIRLRLTSLGEYVAELVDFAKPATVHPEPLSLAPLVDAARATATAALPAVAVETHIDPSILSAGTASPIEADPQRLKVVLDAVLRNGMEAALATSPVPRVRLTVERASAGGVPGIAFAVADNGPGFTEATRQRLCEPFHSTKEAGTGLGLAISRKVMEAHGGALAVTRSPTLGGALVTLFLPSSLPLPAPAAPKKQP